jgi:hypothetical protein
MKIIPFILALLVSIMAVMPCSDGINEHNHDSTEITQHDHTDNGDDECSPFCVCICCGQLFTLQELDLNSFAKPIFNKAIKFLYTSDYSTGYLSSTWHPPSYKLS